MLNQGQIEAIRQGVNTALGLPVKHRFGGHFVFDYVEYPIKEDRVSLTTYKEMQCMIDHAYGLTYGMRDEQKQFRLTPTRYGILIGILECLQAVLRVELLNEGGDLPLPPESKGDR